MSHSHDLTDATAKVLSEYSKNILKLSTMPKNHSDYLLLDCPNINGNQDMDIIIYAARNENGDYTYNDVLVGTLDNALKTYAAACAELIKTISAIENKFDYQEDIESVENDSSSNDDNDDEQFKFLEHVHEDSSFVHDEGESADNEDEGNVIHFENEYEEIIEIYDSQY